MASHTSLAAIPLSDAESRPSKIFAKPIKARLLAAAVREDGLCPGARRVWECGMLTPAACSRRVARPEAASARSGGRRTVQPQVTPESYVACDLTPTRAHHAPLIAGESWQVMTHQIQNEMEHLPSSRVFSVACYTLVT